MAETLRNDRAIDDGVLEAIESRAPAFIDLADRIWGLAELGFEEHRSAEAQIAALEHEGFRLVMDLGYGTLPRLLALVDSVHGAGIDAVVITHKHPDHMLDLHGLFRARWFGDRDGEPIPLYAPAGVVLRLQSLEEDDDDASERAGM